MEIVSLVVALVALAVALLARATAAGARRRIEDQAADARRRVENMAEELRGELELTRRLMARLAGGERLDRDMVLEGRLWGEVEPEAGRKLVEAGEVRLLDVRTASEVASGMIPGALHIPIEELEARLREVAREERRTLIYCAGGARSAAACELLSRAGHEGLLNLGGGFSSWNGARVRPGESA